MIPCWCRCPHQYARLAGALRGRREVTVLPHPGFRPGERLPVDLDAVVAAQARAALWCARGGPMALLGYSSGGWVAHAVAARLEELGHSVEAVVLLDTYLQSEMTDGLASALTEGLFARQSESLDTAPQSLIAMGAYFRVFERWTPTEIAAPTLFLRAAEPLAPAEPEGPSWPLAGPVRDVPGNHFTLLEDHVGPTAETVHEWLTRVAESEQE